MRSVEVLTVDTGQALRDWDYMLEKHNKNPELDPFKLVNTKIRDVCIMREFGVFEYSGVRGRHRRNPEKFEAEVQDYGNPMLPGGSRSWLRERSAAEALVLRFWAALLGGVALIAPMLLMVLHKDIPTSLSAVSVCTIVFAMCIAAFTDKGPLDLMQATAAYAAILVVFVGTSS